GRSGCRPRRSRPPSSIRRAWVTRTGPASWRRTWPGCPGRWRDASAASRPCTRSRPSGPSRGRTRWRSSVLATRPASVPATRRTCSGWGPEPRVGAFPSLSIVIPVYNEVECLDALVAELRAVLQHIDEPVEIIAVDDGSTDGSFERLVALRGTEPRLRVVRLQRNYGPTPPLPPGIALARGTVIVSLDADLQNDPRDIPALLAALRDDVDVVNGWRRERRDPWLSRRLPSQIANRIISLVTGTRLHDYGCTLRAMRASVAK